MQRVFSIGGIKRDLLSMVFILAIMLAANANTMAEERTVGSSGKDFTTIQAAVDVSVDGDTIIVMDADHTEAEINIKPAEGASANPFNNLGLTIKGLGEQNTTIHGRFVVASDPNPVWPIVVSIQDMTICDGVSTGDGGGICNYYSTLTLTNCTVSGNTASGSGGGIDNTGYADLWLINCTVNGNTASGSGGGINGAGSADAWLTNCTVSGNTASGSGGGLYSHHGGDFTLTNCTVSGNTASGSGGGLYNDHDGDFTLTNCTVSGNTAYSGGGIYAGGSEDLRNTIVANNTIDSGGSGPDIYGSVDANYCLIGDTTDCSITISSGEPDNNITEADPLLGPLALNDSLNGTWTHALLEGSPAINTGTDVGTEENPVPGTDQRGFDRVGEVDIGAYEYEYTGDPIVLDVVADPNPAPVDTETVDTEITLTATPSVDMASAEYSIDGGDPVAMTAQNGSFSAVIQQDFTEPGVHTICVQATGSETVEECIFLAVHNPVGYVSGAGWISSPEGAYTPDPTIAGKARFGFISKYQKGANTPTGHTHFRFRAADISFSSDSYEWLVVAEAKAMYKGVGTINRSGNYGFMLSAIDADLTPSTDVDLFRIKIWDKDDGDTVVYDNLLDENAPDDADPTTAIGGGKIRIRTARAAPPHSRFADSGAALPDSPRSFRLLANYPNPFNPETWLPYELAENRSVTIRIYNASGRLVRLLDLGHKPAGFYTSREKSAYWDGRNEAGESVSSGIYFYQIQAGEFSATRKMTILK